MVLKAVLKSISANATWHSSKSSEAPQFDMCATLSPLSAIWGNMQYAIPFVLMRTVEKGCKNCFIARHKCRQRSLWPVHNFICHNTCIYTLVYIYIYAVRCRRNLQHLHLRQRNSRAVLRYYDLLIARNFLTSQSVNIMV